MDKDYVMAFEVAARCHADQLYLDMPYICHPVRVAANFTAGPMQVLALLHDVIEDNPGLAADLLPMIPLATWQLEVLSVLTRGKDEAYADYVSRVLSNPNAAIIKRLDMEDNLSHLPALARRSPRQAAKNYFKYKAVYPRLLEATRLRWAASPINLTELRALVLDISKGGI
jgi:hypothetical protein